MRYELATPLLLANILRWVAPGIFRISTSAPRARSRCLALPAQTDRNSVQVITDAGRTLPFNIRDRTVQFSPVRPRVCV